MRLIRIETVDRREVVSEGIEPHIHHVVVAARDLLITVSGYGTLGSRLTGIPQLKVLREQERSRKGSSSRARICCLYCSGLTGNGNHQELAELRYVTT